MLALAACQIIPLRHDAQPSVQLTPDQARGDPSTSQRWSRRKPKSGARSSRLPTWRLS